MSPHSGDSSQLEKNAKGDSVTAKKLEGNVKTTQYLNENSVMDYLNKYEQPHYFLYSGDFPIIYDGKKVATGTATTRSLVVTDQRMLLVIKTMNDESVWEIPYKIVKNTSSKTGRTKHSVTITTSDHEYILKFPGTFFGPFGFSSVEIENATSYIQDISETSAEGTTEKRRDITQRTVEDPFADLNSITPSEHSQDKMESNQQPTSRQKSVELDTQDDPPNKEGDHKMDPEIQTLIDEAEGETVTYESLVETAMFAALDENEQPHYILEGNAVLVERGDEIQRKGGVGKSVVTAVTNKRVFCNIEGKGLINIPYDTIISIEYGLPPEDEWEINIPFLADFSGQTEKLILQTEGSTYYFDLTERMGILPDNIVKDEYSDVSELVSNVINFIRNKRERSKDQSNSSESKATESDPLKQIERLKKLHEQDAITDKEFEEKKSDLLDQV